MWSTRSKINISGDIIGLDVGASRTGVARLHTQVRIAEPLQHIKMGDNFLESVSQVVAENSASAVVVGLPRGLDGQETEQTAYVRKLIVELKNGLKVPVYEIDEAGTTKQAEIQAKPDDDVDSVAAGILLEDFTQEVLRGKVADVTL